MNHRLALVNAVLSAATIALAVGAWRAIRARRVALHRNLMLAALAASAAFVVVFVVRFVLYGFTPYAGSGAGRVIHAIVFFSHEPLAVVNIPLVLAAAILGLLRRDKLHRELARWALPIWLYVAATGIVLWLLLYVL